MGTIATAFETPVHSVRGLNLVNDVRGSATTHTTTNLATASETGRVAAGLLGSVALYDRAVADSSELDDGDSLVQLFDHSAPRQPADAVVPVAALLGVDGVRTIDDRSISRSGATVAPSVALSANGDLLVAVLLGKVGFFHIRAKAGGGGGGGGGGLRADLVHTADLAQSLRCPVEEARAPASVLLRHAEALARVGAEEEDVAYARARGEAVTDANATQLAVVGVAGRIAVFCFADGGAVTLVKVLDVCADAGYTRGAKRVTPLDVATESVNPLVSTALVDDRAAARFPPARGGRIAYERRAPAVAASVGSLVVALGWRVVAYGVALVRAGEEAGANSTTDHAGAAAPAGAAARRSAAGRRRAAVVGARVVLESRADLGDLVFPRPDDGTLPNAAVALSACGRRQFIAFAGRVAVFDRCAPPLSGFELRGTEELAKSLGLEAVGVGTPAIAPDAAGTRLFVAASSILAILDVCPVPGPHAPPPPHETVFLARRTYNAAADLGTASSDVLSAVAVTADGRLVHTAVDAGIALSYTVDAPHASTTFAGGMC